MARLCLSFDIHHFEIEELHGLVDPLFVTSWYKWNRYNLHRGKSLYHVTRNGPMEVYDLCHGSR